MPKCIFQGCKNKAKDGSNYCVTHQPIGGTKRKFARKKAAKKGKR
jgi:hypothetical protein